jgi:hypothetical protein
VVPVLAAIVVLRGAFTVHRAFVPASFAVEATPPVLPALIVFFLMPALWLPIGTTVATVGVHPEHRAASQRVWGRPSYWLWFARLLGAVVYVP